MNQYFHNYFHSHPGLTILFIVLVLWSLVWKGFALWKAARAGDKAWFIILLVLNTAGILDMFYIFLFHSRPQEKQISNS